MAGARSPKPVAVPRLASGGGGPRDAASRPARRRPSHLARPGAPGLRSASPAPAPWPPVSRSAAAHGLRPRPCGWAPAGGLCAPHTRPRVLSPAAFRALGGARSRDPSASLRPTAAHPATSPGRDAPLCATITPTRRAPTPRGTSANGSSPGPGPTCTAQPSLEWGGQASALLCLSLARPRQFANAIGCEWTSLRAVGRDGGGGEMLVPRRLCLCISHISVSARRKGEA